MTSALFSSATSGEPVISDIISDLRDSLTQSHHQLTVLASSQEDLETISPDFSDGAGTIKTGLCPGNLSETKHTEQLYRNIKGSRGDYPDYWDQDLQHELQDFQARIENLERLSGVYKRYLQYKIPGKEVPLTFVMSKPDSPLIAIYNNNNRAMVYNFSW